MDNVRKTIQVRLSEGEDKMFKDLCDRFGCGISELVKDWLRYNHKKTFPMYATVRKIRPLDSGEIKLTPEQECEKNGGKVFNNNGTPSCRIPTVGQSAVIMPLTAWKDFEKYKKP